MKSLSTISKPLKTLLGIAAVWPLLYIPFFFIIVISLALSTRQDSNTFPTVLLIVFPLHFLTIIGGFVQLGLYVYDLFKNDRIQNDKKALWAVVIFLGGIVAIPVYWYLYIWKTAKPGTVKKKKR